MRGLLIINPQATTTTGNTTDLAIRSLAGLVDLDVEHTQYRGHARVLAAEARGDLVIVLGGDGAVNEAVNGIMCQRSGGGPGGGPLLAVIPGGGANVFARALGLPVDPAAAIGRIRDVIADGPVPHHRARAGRRPVLHLQRRAGLDAEVVEEVERKRAAGHKESPGLFAWTIARQWATGTDRRRPALTLERDGQPVTTDLFMTAVTNRSPWTYLRGRALLPVPNPDFSSGLDVLALRKLRATTHPERHGPVLFIRRHSPRGRNRFTVTDLDRLTIRSARPIAFQLDGDSLGETEAVKFRFLPAALRVVV